VQASPSTEKLAGSHLTARRIQRLRTKGKDISIRWTKAHAGTAGNEAADAAAKEARGKEEKMATQAYLHEQISKAFAKESYPGPPNRDYIKGPGKKASKMENAPKRLAAAAAQLRTNHALTGPYLRRIKKRVTSLRLLSSHWFGY